MIGRNAKRQAYRRLLASRICTSLAACFLMLAFAVAALGPVGLSLGNAANRLDDGLPARLYRTCPTLLWHQVVLPLLARPAWVLPAALGILCSGLAITVARPFGLDLRRRRR